MLRKFIRPGIPLLILLVLLITLSIFSQKPVVQKRTEAFTKLSLSVSANKTEFLPLEPIQLTFSLKNASPGAINGHSEMGFKYRYLRISVTDEKGETVQISNPSAERCNCETPEQKTINPGDSFQKREILFNLHSVFPTSGTYRLQATFKNTEGAEEVASPSISVKIVEPTGIDLAAFNFVVSQPGRKDFLFAGIENENIYQDLHSNYEESLYGVYADYFLGNRYLIKGEYDKAEQLLTASLKHGDFVFADSAREALEKVKELKKKKTRIVRSN